MTEDADLSTHRMQQPQPSAPDIRRQVLGTTRAGIGVLTWQTNRAVRSAATRMEMPSPYFIAEYDR